MSERTTAGGPSRSAVVWLVKLAFLALSGLADACTADSKPPAAGPNDASVVVCGPGSFSSGNECLPVRPECPQSTVFREGQCVPEEVEPVSPPPLVTAAEVAAPSIFEEVLDTRRAWRQPRSRQLLITEIQSLESLFQSVAKTSPDRPRLMRRLAEGYVELEAAALRDLRTATGEEKVKAGKIEPAARQAAIKYLSQLVQQYPQFCGLVSAAGSTQCQDETQYHLSLEHIRGKQLDQARRSLLTLIQSYPQSDFLGHAYFLFGEMFRDEIEQDPSKFAFAEQSYKEAAKYTTSPAAPIALYRLGEVLEKKGDPARARSVYKNLLKQYPTSAAADLIPTNMR